MEDAFEKLCTELRALNANRNSRKTTVAVRRKPNQGDLRKSLSFAIENKAIGSADACRIDLLIRQGKVPANLQRALIGLHAPETMAKAEPPVAMADVRTPLSIIASQADTRARLNLAYSAGAVSKLQYHRLSKLLDNGKELPANVMRELAKVRLDSDGTADGGDGGE